MATFSKRHYVVIANVLRGEYAQSGEHEHERAMVYIVADALADELERDNPSFNREHFLAVVRGEREPDSRPPRSGSRSQGDGRYSHSRPWED